MSGTHDKLPKLFWVQIILVAIVGTLYLLAPKATKHIAEASTEVKPVVKKAQQALAPIGKVETKVEAPAPGPCVARTGESIYKETCSTCHNTGIANAPKIDDKAAWEPRIEKGIDALVKTAIAGKGAMPARGGNPAITDEEIKEVILYMTKSAGLEVSAPKKADAAPTSAETATTTTMPAPVTAATSIAKPPKAPAAPESPTAPEPAVAVNEAPKAPEAITEQTETPKAPVPEMEQKEMPKAPEPEMAQKEAPESPEAVVAAVKTQETPVIDLAKGEKVYKTSCFACHATGVAGSPKVGDVTAWASRIATGKQAMYASAINGKGVMPPKGGNLSLSDEDVKAAVDYMSAKSQ